MRADEWKSILVRVDGLKGNLPPAHAMAEIALRPVFPAMQVGVTILAVAAHVREHWIEVALLAGNTGVQAAQWITSLVVIKLGLVAYRLPGRGCMTLLTCNLHRPVWTRLGLG